MTESVLAVEKEENLLLLIDGALGDPVVGTAALRSDAPLRVADVRLRSAGVMPQVASLLPLEARARIAAVIVGTGPGSYSGIRSAAGAAASIAIALGVRVVPLPSDLAIARAAGARVDLPLGAREVLRITSDGARLLRRGEAEEEGAEHEAARTQVLDPTARGALAEPLLAVLAEMGRAALREGATIDPARTPIELRYLAQPRGVAPSESAPR